MKITILIVIIIIAGFYDQKLFANYDILNTFPIELLHKFILSKIIRPLGQLINMEVNETSGEKMSVRLLISSFIKLSFMVQMLIKKKKIRFKKYTGIA